MLTLSYVQVEEIAVEYCLNASCNNCNRIKEALILETIYPVEDVESAIHALSKQVMACDCLGFTSFADHEQLRKNGDRFKIDGKCPKNLDKNV